MVILCSIYDILYCAKNSWLFHVHFWYLFQHLNLQDHVIKDVIIPLLGDEDQRVRQGAASAIVKYANYCILHHVVITFTNFLASFALL